MSNSISFKKAEQRNYNLLLVDDDPHMLDVTHEILADEGYHITTATSGEAAIEALQTKDFDLVITDLNMGQLNGISVLKKAKELKPEIMVIITTACSDVAYIIKALQLNANDYILKPFKLDDLLYRVSLCLEKSFSLGFHHTRHIKIA